MKLLLDRACLRGRQGWRVDHVSVELYPGEFLALLGPNGAGKSSVLKLLAGELACDKGLAMLGDRDLHSLPPQELARRRAVLPQTSALAFGFKVHEVVMMGRSAHRGCGYRVDQEVVAWAMETADVMALSGQSYIGLSGGERQRVHLARVLAQIGSTASAVDASVSRFLLLDEPTAALDLSHQHQVLTIVTELARSQGIAVLAILHDLNLAALYANRVALLKHGKLEAIGLSQDILTPSRIAQVFDVQASVMAHPHRSECQLIVTG